MSSKSGTSNERVETKFQGELKRFLEQRASSSSTERFEKTDLNNPVEDFFADERRLVAGLLSIARKDVETTRLSSTATPTNWLGAWPAGPKEAMSFVRALAIKSQVLSSLMLGLPERLDLDALTRPWAFLAALKQHTVRKTGYPLEELKLVADWSDTLENAHSKVFVNLDGILISGALIVNGKLKELDATASPVAAVKNCRIFYTPETSGNNDDDSWRAKQDSLDIPVYADSRRSRLICSLPVECDPDQLDSWLRRGVILHLRNG